MQKLYPVRRWCSPARSLGDIKSRDLRSHCGSRIRSKCCSPILWLGCSLLLSQLAPAVIAQDRQTRRSADAQRERDRPAADAWDDEGILRRGESPALGVIVASCPGNAVCVRGTVFGSPADEAGIREGDYILALNGLRVTSPEELKMAVERSERGRQAEVVIWRNGRELTRQVDLATQADELPPGQRAWLGVQLQESEDGVVLARVLQGGPADRAGLRDGDIALEVNGQEVSAPRSDASRQISNRSMMLPSLSCGTPSVPQAGKDEVPPRSKPTRWSMQHSMSCEGKFENCKNRLTN
jgi:hypothetical protein